MKFNRRELFDWWQFLERQVKALGLVVSPGAEPDKFEWAKEVQNFKEMFNHIVRHTEDYLNEVQ